MKFKEIVKILKNETNGMFSVNGTHRHSQSTFRGGIYWHEDENALCQLARFMVEGEIIQPTDKTEDGEQKSQLTIEIDPIEFDYYDNCVGDYCLSPKMIISKITNTKFLVDIFDVEELEDRSDEYETYYYANYIAPRSIEINLSDEDLREIKDSLYYKLSKEIETKTNEELAEEIQLEMENYNINLFQARNELIMRYGQAYHAKLTWIMYNLVKSERA